MDRSDVRVYYDASNKRLVYVGRPADEDYWDDHWSKDEAAKAIRRQDRFVVRTTQAFLPRGARVIDAGCGLAQTVNGLHNAGYDAYGIDYAHKTVDLVNAIAPELKVTIGDVRDLSQFSDGSFDGCWSLGVVEHFYNGYDQIIREMRRILRPGGYAFVTVPYMSPLRRWKAATRAFPQLCNNDVTDFYQFILPADSVISAIEPHGFKLISTSARGGFKGLKDEAGTFLRRPMQTFYDSQNKVARGLRVALDKALSPLSGHSRLYVFRTI